ncbi:MAG: hypothetical protein ACP5N0_05285, partial [Methanosarcina sp.]
YFFNVFNSFFYRISLRKTAWRKMSLESEIPHEGKESLNLKKPCKVPLIKLKNHGFFNFAFLNTILTKVFGIDLSRPPAGEIYLK